MKNPVWALLRRNISVGQMAGYAVANLAGLAIVLTAIQFYRDATATTEADTQVGRDFLVLSKRVQGLSAVSSGFTAQEVADLEEQPWAERVGHFTASRFQVTGSVRAGGQGLSTYLFFESVPDEFLDIMPRDWHFDPARPAEVPIILSKDYLALYNFGFSATQGLPQVGEKLVGTIPVDLYMRGPGGDLTARGYVCGFSSRLNTIAVPQEFMDWANARLAPGEDAEPSRLIVEVNSPGSPAIDAYLAEHDWEMAGDKELTSRTARYLTIVTTAVSGVGIVISLLALFILMLSLYLLLQKSRHTLRMLMLQGYSPSAIGHYYRRIVTATNAAVALLAFTAMMGARAAWLPAIGEMGFGAASPWFTLAVALGIALCITLINFAAIRRTLLRIWHE